MTKLGLVAIVCALLSGWGIIQLTLMGVFYSLESVLLIEDVEPHTFASFEDFLKKTEENYKATSINCFIAAAIYVVFMGLSIIGIKYSQRVDLKQKELMEDDEYICKLVEDTLQELTEEEKKKIK